MEMCGIHINEPAVNYCQICGNPICIKCIEERRGICNNCNEIKSSIEIKKIKKYLINDIAEMKKRKEYLIISTSIFIGLFLLFLIPSYYLIKIIEVSYTKDQGTEILKGIPFLLKICLMSLGYTTIISALYCGIQLFTKFIKKASTTIKVLSGVLFFISIQMIYFGGMVMFIPYYIYNWVKYVKLKKKIIEEV